MVGGRAPNVENERLYRFEFPESPGALSRFLAALSGGWNVSLFHYRNHGSDFGRVLAAFQVCLVSRDAKKKYVSRTLLWSHTVMIKVGHVYVYGRSLAWVMRQSHL